MVRTMPQLKFETAAVIGTGMMGPGIALTLAMGGMHASIVSRTAEGAVEGIGKARAQARILIENGLADAADTERALERIGGSCDLEAAVRGVDLVVESGPEDMAWKQQFFAHMDAAAGPEAVLATNTSGLSITEIARHCARPERVLTAHFWNPPHLMPLVEIVKGERTSVETVNAVRDLLVSCGKTPVVVKKDRPGQLGNRLQMALLREAVNIVAEGIADAADVDAVAKNGFGLRMPAYGIFEHQDVVGLAMGVKILEYVAHDLFSEPRAPEYMRELVRQGRLGTKTGQGFYEWSEGSADEVRARRDAFLIEVLQYRNRIGSRG
jgi:3-hydroxybutyryl-CoA dehydrogenase